MASTIITKYNTSAGVAPSAGQLVVGELAVNVTDKRLYTLDASNQVVLISSGSDYVVPVTITVNSATAALRVTQTNNSPGALALLVEDSANPDSTPIVVDAAGLMVLGATTNQAANLATGNAKLQILGGTAPLAFFRDADSSTAINLEFAKRRATGGVLQSGDIIGRLYFSGNDGTAAIPAAFIDAAVDGTPGTNDMPGRLVFSTTADGASLPTERMRIDSTGAVGIGTTSLGSGYGLRVSKTVTGVTSGIGILNTVTADSTITNLFGYNTNLNSATNSGTPYTLNNFVHYNAAQGTINTDSTVTNQVGYQAASTLTGATNNYGFYGNLAAATGAYNFYAAGTAGNYFAGNVGIGTNAPLAALNVNGAGGELIRISVTADGATPQEPALGFATGVTNTNPAAKISALEFDASDSRASLLFYTRGTNSDIAPTERLRITSSGGISFGSSGTAYGTAGQALVSAGDAAPVWTDQFLSITYIFSNINAGDQGDLTIPFDCTITEWTLLADVSGSAVIDIWGDTYANYPPTVADTITGSAKPTISASTKGRSSTLTGWTTTIAAGSTLRFNVDSASTVNRVTLSLKVKRT